MLYENTRPPFVSSPRFTFTTPCICYVIMFHWIFALLALNINHQYQIPNSTTETTSIDLMPFDRQDIVSVRLSLKWEKPSIALVTILKVSISFSFSCSAIFFPSNRPSCLAHLHLLCTLHCSIRIVDRALPLYGCLSKFFKLLLKLHSTYPFECPLENTFSCR